MKTVRTTCCYCGVGCGMLVDTVQQDDSRQDNQDNQDNTGNRSHAIRIAGVRGDPDHPANRGRLCSKGSTLGQTAQAHLYDQARAGYPEIRSSRGSPRVRVGWDVALDHVAQRFAATIASHGPDSVAVYASGQLLTEDYYVFNKLVKGLVGTNNIDTNSRLCMSSAVSGYKQSLGADAPPCSYEDIDHAQTLFITGSNTAYAHPIVFRRIEEARARNPALKLVVVDPRRTDTADMADLFLQILPGTDVALHHGMLHVMIRKGWIDQRYIDTHTVQFDRLRELVEDYPPAHTAALCGISVDELTQAAELFACSPATLSLYCQGLNQSGSGTAKNSSLINLHLATGQIGKAGAGPFSLTGQPNAMGGREVGGLAHLLSAHRDLRNPEHRREVAQLWGVRDVPATAGLSAVPMFEALRSGKLKAIWIVCTNPAQSMPDQNLIREALARAEFVVVQEAYAHTATAHYADVLLPATTWGEKEGTVTNSERRISRVRPALPAYRESRNDWEIALAVGRRLERLLPSPIANGASTLFPWQDVKSIWEEHRETTRGRDLDITGLSYEMLDAAGPQQWPYPEGAAGGLARLYTDGHFAAPGGRAQFIAEPFRQTAEQCDATHPFGLNTGRLRDQWHGMSRTGTLSRLFAHAGTPAVEISLADAGALGLDNGDLAQVSTRRGELVLPVQIVRSVRSGQAFIPMHWGSEFLSGRGAGGQAYGVNSLTSPACDPVSQQPELKFAAAGIRPAIHAWHLQAAVLVEEADAVALQVRLRDFYPEADFASSVLLGRGNDDGLVGVYLQLANTGPIEEGKLQALLALLGLSGPAGVRDVMTYQDLHAHSRRWLCVEAVDGARVLKGFLVAGPKSATGSAGWLRHYLLGQQDVSALGNRLLMPGAQPPGEVVVRGKTVCNCFDVSADAIESLLKESPEQSPQDMLGLLQSTLCCGTNCGSCVPELRTMIASCQRCETAVVS
ncbi:nitrate reductase [Lacisediminimonas profundi]|uniref:nitrate reductase n=1 Tax=Lacisediminimonas profundi TaxID=2603856 RepID=UPI00124AE7D4|nr:nitrate reductase [Lacisediminimonas profundi]